MMKNKTRNDAFKAAQLLRLTLLSVSILLLFYSSLPIPAHGAIQGTVSSDGQYYKYIVTNLPDFDQKRKTVNYGSTSLVGLTGDGKMYCVPTATLNILAYIATHGFPEVTPGFGFWNSYTTTNYNNIGTVLKDLGTRMYTDPSDGTTKYWWYASLMGKPFIFAYPYEGLLPYDKFTISAYIKDSASYAPRISKLTKAAIMTNGLVAIMHGWYKVTGEFQGQKSFVRDGGHCMTLERVNGVLSGTDEVKLRDPASENVSSPYSQSTFASNLYYADAANVCIGYYPFCSSYGMTKLTPAVSDSDNRFIDGAILISTKSAYSFSADFNSILLIKAIKLLGSNSPEVQSFSIGAEGGNVKDIAMTPDMDGFTVISGTQVYNYDPFTGNMVTVLPGGFSAPIKLIYSRQRNLYVLDGQDLVRIDTDLDEPQEINRVTLPTPYDNIAFDDSTDEVVIFSASSRSLLRYPFHLDARPEPIAIPEEFFLGENPSFVINPSDKSTWIMNNEENVFYRIKQFRDELLVEPFTHPELQNPQSFDFDDAGNIFVSMNGMISEFAVNENGQLELLEESPFAGQPAGSILKITHSRTNYDEALHGGPEWRDVFPESVAPGIPDCPADIAPEGGDGIVNREDLRLVIRHWWRGWGDPADIDDDGIVNRKDLFAVIKGWGRCAQ